jgi:hypothetical protein
VAASHTRFAVSLLTREEFLNASETVVRERPSAAARVRIVGDAGISGGFGIVFDFDWGSELHMAFG